MQDRSVKASLRYYLWTLPIVVVQPSQTKWSSYSTSHFICVPLALSRCDVNVRISTGFYLPPKLVNANWTVRGSRLTVVNCDTLQVRRALTGDRFVSNFSWNSVIVLRYFNTLRLLLSPRLNCNFFNFMSTEQIVICGIAFISQCDIDFGHEP